MATQSIVSLPQPLPIVVLILGLFALCALALVGLLIADRIVEGRSARLVQGESLQLSFDSLIGELTSYA